MNITIERQDVAEATNQLLDTVCCSLTAQQELEYLEWLILTLKERQENVE